MPGTIETVAQQCGLTTEQVKNFEREAVEKCKSKTLQRFLRTDLHTISLRLIEEVTPHPDTPVIAEKLRKLAELRSASESSKADYEAKKAKILLKIQPELDALETEYAPLFKALTEQETNTAAEIKNDVLRFGASVRTEKIKAVFTKGRVSWDTKGLTRYAEAHPDILEFRKQGAPLVIIRFNHPVAQTGKTEAADGK